MQNSCVEVRRFGEKCKHLNVTSRIANQLIMMTNWAAHDENAYRDKKWKHTKVTDAHIERTLSILAELITSIIDNVRNPSIFYAIAPNLNTFVVRRN